MQKEKDDGGGSSDSDYGDWGADDWAFDDKVPAKPKVIIYISRYIFTIALDTNDFEIVQGVETNILYLVLKIETENL